MAVYKEEDLSRGILEAIDMESYRAEKHAVMRIRNPGFRRWLSDTVFALTYAPDAPIGASR